MDMNVMMIGFAATGKTSYMGVMYNRFNESNVEGFSIRATDDDHHKSFVRIGKELKCGRYPQSTDILDQYNFTLEYRHDEILNFNWTDYRGGVLAERSSEDMNVVVSKIINSDALIVFLDSKALVYGNTNESQSVLRRISMMIQQTASKLDPETQLPISIVLTKADELDSFESLTASPAFSMLKQIIEKISNSKNIFGLMTWTIVGRQSANVEYPFLFSMHFGLRKKCLNLVAEYEQKKSDMEFYASKSGLWDNLTSLIYAEPTYAELANQKYNEVNKLADCANKIIQPLENVAEYLEREAQKKDIPLWLF